MVMEAIRGCGGGVACGLVIRSGGCAFLYPFMLDLTKLEQAEWAKAKGMTLKEFSRWFREATMADADEPRQARRGRRAKKYQTRPPARRKSKRLSQQECRIRYFEKNPGEVKILHLGLWIYPLVPPSERENVPGMALTGKPVGKSGGGYLTVHKLSVRRASSSCPDSHDDQGRRSKDGNNQRCFH